MKALVTLIALLFGTVLVTLAAVHDPGYVLIERHPWSLEMPLTLFVLLLILAVALLYFVLHVTLRLFRIPRDVGRWRLDRRLRHLQKTLHKGLIKLIEGDFAAAERDLVGDTQADDVPGIHYLAAACAAQGQEQYERRDQYLTRAQGTNGLALAAGLLQAHLHESAHEHERALATLSALRVAYPGNRVVLRLLARRARALRDWTVVARLAPELRRYRALDPAAIDELELEAHRQLLKLATANGADAEAAWRAIPRARRAHPTLVALYAQSLIGKGAEAEAEDLLVPALRHQLHDDLLAAYGALRGPETLRRLSQAEGWLKTVPDNGALLLCLARLACEAKLPGKAREYAERCARQANASEHFAELALVMEQLGDGDQAREYYRRGLKLRKAACEPPAEGALLPL